MWGASFKMIKRRIGATCGTTLLVTAAVVVALRERRQPLPSPEAPVAQTPADVRVKAVERKADPVESINIDTEKFSKKKPKRSLTEFGILSPETV